MGKRGRKPLHVGAENEFGFTVPWHAPIPKTATIITTSSRNTLLNCPKKYWYRYVRGVTPQKKSDALDLGSAVHQGLDDHYHGKSWEGIQQGVDAAFPSRGEDARQKHQWHMATAMLAAYIANYSVEDWRPAYIEQVFHSPIVDPVKGRATSRFIFAGKCDGIVQKPDGSFWLLEHKTAARVDTAYLERLWNDPQIISYVHFLEQFLRISITGVIYNVLLKSTLKQRMGETYEEFVIRRDEAARKNKSGKSSATQQIAETDEEFQARLADTSGPHMFHREEILIDSRQTGEFETELFESVHMLRAIRKRNHWLKNRTYCHSYNTMCGYWHVCQARDRDEEEAHIEIYCEVKEPHVELFGEKEAEAKTEDVMQPVVDFSPPETDYDTPCFTDEPF